MNRNLVSLAVLFLAALLVAAGGGASRPRPETVTEFLRVDATAAPSAARTAALSWHGGPITASTGETVTVFISDSYPPEQVSQQTWADFFAALPHGAELSLLTIYVAPLAEVQQACGGVEGVLGCYGGDVLYLNADSALGIGPQEIARHEYGHHIAAHRVNTPWPAIAWGPKRWATAENICSRQGGGTAYPGDEGINYKLNPGEAWSETYRTLVDKRANIPFSWQIVDSSFIPTDAALAAAEQDVLQPWTTVTSKVSTGLFVKKGRPVWTLPIKPPLDGLLQLTLNPPAGGVYDLTLLGPDGKQVLGKGLASGGWQKSLTFPICGQRTLSARVTAHGILGRFSLKVTEP